MSAETKFVVYRFDHTKNVEYAAGTHSWSAALGEANTMGYYEARRLVLDLQLAQEEDDYDGGVYVYGRTEVASLTPPPEPEPEMFVVECDIGFWHRCHGYVSTKSRAESFDEDEASRIRDALDEVTFNSHYLVEVGD